jgi:hypothetical protein
MARIRPLLVALLVVGPSLASASVAEASGGTGSTPRHVPAARRAPSVACSVVAWPEGGAPVSPGQVVKIHPKTGKVWMKLVLENRGLTTQTVTPTVILWDGTRQVLNRPLANYPPVTTDTKSETGSWSMDLAEGTHKVRVGGFLDLKGNSLSNDCGPVDFTVEVGAPILALGRARAVIKPDVTCRLTVVPFLSPGGSSQPPPVASGQTLTVPGAWDFMADVTVTNNLQGPYNGKSQLNVIVDDNNQRQVKQFSVATPLESGRDLTYRHQFHVAAGQHTMMVLAEVIVPNNRSAPSPQASTNCAGIVRFTVSASQPASPTPTAPRVFTERVYPILTDSSCLTCHNPNGVAGRARLVLAFGIDGNTPRAADVLCTQLQRQISPNEAHPPFPLPQTYLSAVSLWRDTPPPPTYKCP